METLKGQQRRRRLIEIYHENEVNRRIIQHRFGSLKRLAERSGIDPHAVAIQAYRDESDVHHDLDLLQQSGQALRFETLKKGHKRLYNVISETGWGRERLESAGRRIK